MSGLVFVALLSHTANATDSLTATASRKAHNIESAATFFDESALLSVVQEQAPGRYDFLMELRAEDEDRFLAQLHWDGHILLLEQADPRVPELRQDLWAIDADIEVLAEELSQTSGKGRRELQGLLQELAEERVELHLSMLEIQAELTLQRLNRLESRLDTMDEEKISRRIVRRANRRAR